MCSPESSRLGAGAGARLLHRYASLVIAFTLSCSRDKTAETRSISAPPPSAPTADTIEVRPSVAPSQDRQKSSKPIEVALRYACDEKLGTAGTECAPDSEAYKRWRSTVIVSPSPDLR